MTAAQPRKTVHERPLGQRLLFLIGMIATGVYVLLWSVLNGLISGFNTEGYTATAPFWITCVAPVVLWALAWVLAIKLPSRAGLWIATIPLVLVALLAIFTFWNSTLIDL